MSEKGTNPYAGGYMFFRWLARQSGDLTITNFDAQKTTLQTFYGNDLIKTRATTPRLIPAREMIQSKAAQTT